MSKPTTCIEKGCHRKRETSRKRCRRCRRAKFKARKPISYTYSVIKNNAKRRGVHFDLTLEQFTAFCNSTGYISGKGQTKDSLTIDRKDNTKGYTADNIHVLTLSQNSSKGTTDWAWLLGDDFDPKEDVSVAPF